MVHETVPGAEYEHMTENHGVPGSNPGLATSPFGLDIRNSGIHLFPSLSV